MSLHAGCPLRASVENEDSAEHANPSEKLQHKWIANHWIEVADDLADDWQLATTLGSRQSRKLGKERGHGVGKRSGRRKRTDKAKGEL